MELKDYLAKRKMVDKGFRRADFAKLIKISPTKLSLVTHYKKFPTALQAYAIEKETKGIVKGWDLILHCVKAKAGRDLQGSSKSR